MKRRLALALVVVVVIVLIAAAFQWRFSDLFAESSDTAVNEVIYLPNGNVFEPVLPDNPVVLPRDFTFHYEFQHSWWHFFANVSDKQGNQYSVQWSYFRIANHDTHLEGWLNSQLYMANVVISNQQQVWREQRIARGGIGQAGMSQKPFKMWIDNWDWRSLGLSPFPGVLNIETDQLKLSLHTSTSGPLVVPGERGYVKKHDLLPVASHVITAPFLSVHGELQLDDGQPFQVKGKAWMSKEWGSGLLGQGQQGWDWFVINLDNQTTLSVSRFRQDKQIPYLFGTLASNDGKVIELNNDQLTIVPTNTAVIANGKSIPTQWQISVPEYGINVESKTQNDELWLPFALPYWQGPIETQGSHQAQGFMQLVGY